MIKECVGFVVFHQYFEVVVHLQANVAIQGELEVRLGNQIGRGSLSLMQCYETCL